MNATDESIWAAAVQLFEHLDNDKGLDRDGELNAIAACIGMVCAAYGLSEDKLQSLFDHLQGVSARVLMDYNKSMVN